MYILTISKGTLQSESNRFCSHKARSRVDNDLHLRQVLVLARTFRRRTSTNSPRSCSIKRTLDLSSEYMKSLVNSCCTDPGCSELWIERISRRSRDVRGEELGRMRLWGSSNRSGSTHESSRTSRCKKVRLLRVESKKLKVHGILL